jgi:methionyl-tRNA synthetase
LQAGRLRGKGTSRAILARIRKGGAVCQPGKERAMGLLDKLFGRSEAPEAVAEREPERTACPHLALVARWDAVEDMGHEERATGYHCESCGQDFSAEEGHRLRAGEGDRIRMAAPPDSLN